MQSKSEGPGPSLLPITPAAVPAMVDGAAASPAAGSSPWHGTDH